jgi:hypothetical protein
MGRLGLKDKHLAEDDQRCLGEAAGLDDQSLIKLVSKSYNCCFAVAGRVLARTPMYNSLGTEAMNSA